ncbi:ImmA/IrrE family metallo-endopeptidase [Fibrobacter succinogenes]|uniref:ImmA/IrrE family metallo-endopeptidase n=1 Tax=Fibrobacter succinogenes TaxID=833 RepID=UPI00350E4DCC
MRRKGIRIYRRRYGRFVLPIQQNSARRRLLVLNWCLALFAGDFAHELGHLIAGELGANLRDEFSGVFVADFKMGDAFRVV